MRQTYNKLIRDRIPEIIEADGKTYAIQEMSPEAYREALLQKLLEEAQEVQEAGIEKNKPDLVKELADLFEVIDTLIHFEQLDRMKIKQIQEDRQKKRGGFTKRLELLWVDDNN